jgi:transposase
MQKVQKTYTPEFKREAVQLAQTSGKPIAQVARELGISDTSIHQWRKELADHGLEALILMFGISTKVGQPHYVVSRESGLLASLLFSATF